jgi:hypothetical protein
VLTDKDVTNVIEVIKGGTGRGSSPLASTEVGRNLRTAPTGRGGTCRRCSRTTR